jgi:hypothetical protein
VISPSRTREAILAAIRARRCYATSGAKILLAVHVAGFPMGSELDIDGPVEVHARVLGTTDIERIELMTPDGIAVSDAPKSPSASFVGEVDAAYVYCRVTQADGEMAWSSPIFFNRV